MHSETKKTRTGKEENPINEEIKENAEKELRNIFTEILNSWENDCTEHELKKAKDELEQSLKETNEELYQPTFELWTCYGFIKGTITKTKIQ